MLDTIEKTQDTEITEMQNFGTSRCYESNGPLQIPETTICISQSIKESKTQPAYVSTIFTINRMVSGDPPTTSAVERARSAGHPPVPPAWRKHPASMKDAA